MMEWDSDAITIQNEMRAKLRSRLNTPLVTCTRHSPLTKSQITSLTHTGCELLEEGRLDRGH